MKARLVFAMLAVALLLNAGAAFAAEPTTATAPAATTLTKEQTAEIKKACLQQHKHNKKAYTACVAEKEKEVTGK